MQLKALNCLTLPVSVVFLVLVGLPGMAQEQAHSDLETFAEEWAQSFAENDPKKLLSFYEKSEKLEVRASSGMTYEGFENLAEAYRDELSEVAFSVSDVEAIKIRSFGETATISFNHTAEFKVIQADTSHRLRVQTVLVVRKLEEQWKIANEVSTVILGVPRLEVIK